MDKNRILGIDREVVWRNRREAKAYYHAFRYNQPNTVRLLIFAQGRTGSTLLENLLASTGHFQEHGEVLGANNERVRFPALYLKGLARQHREQNFQCHVKIYQLLQDRIDAGANPINPHSLLKAVEQDGWKIIYLQRRNKFQHYLSGCLARARGSYHKFDNVSEDFHIEINKADLLRGVQSRSRIDEQEQDALLGIDHMALTYEDDLKNKDKQTATINRVLDYLSLPQRQIKTHLKKINSRPQQEIIKNYQDVIRWAEEFDLEI